MRILLAALPLFVLLLWTVVYPNVAVISGSMGHWREFVESPSDVEALVNSLVISVASVGAALLIGVPLAFLLTRVDFPGRRILRVAATLPAALPPLVGVISFLFLYGDSGFVTRIIQDCYIVATRRGICRGSVRSSSFTHIRCMCMCISLCQPVWSDTTRLWMKRRSAWVPLLSGGSPRNAPAADAGHRRFRTVGVHECARVVLGTVCLWGWRAGVVHADPQLQTERRHRLAYVETAVLALSAVAGSAALPLDRAETELCSIGEGERYQEISRPVAARPHATAAASAIVVLMLVLPHLMVLLVSFAKDGVWTTQLLPPVYTMANYVRLFSENQLWTPIVNSVTMSLLATAANVIFCFIAAYLIVLRRFPGRGVLELLIALPWAIPATAIALGLLATFNQNHVTTGKVLLVGTFWILPLAYFIRDIPLVASAVEGSLRQMDPSLEQAARGLGASWWRTIWRIVLPAARPGLVAGRC